MVLNDAMIIDVMSNAIRPFVDHKVRAQNGRSVISYGLGGAGYDLRLASSPCILLEQENNNVIDVKQFISDDFPQIKCINGTFLLPAHASMLGVVVEHVSIPLNITAHALGKSTLARVGIHVNTTPLEPGWHGYLTVEISNQTGTPVLVYANEGICQLQFHQLSNDANNSYAGAYQAQSNVPTGAIVSIADYIIDVPHMSQYGD